MRLVRYADEPELREIRYETLGSTFPEYMHHNDPGNRFWGRLYSDFPEFQVALLDGADLVAEAHALPVAWDGSLADLPTGWDDAFVRGMTSDREPTSLSALAISVHPSRRGESLSERMIAAFRDTARDAGLDSVIAPVRPTLKEHYPLIPIEEFVGWRREDGSHFDPWIRIHERVGGEIVAPAPESMFMQAPVSDWEKWTGMRFPADGEYTFPGALATLRVENGIGTHIEPNVWLRHAV
jgi:GNAT superfamily N-acetyltransferase